MRRTLDELPESLDETYERILKEIKKPNREHARRLLSCLVVAVRPLLVEELAEVLAVDFDDAKGIPRLNPNWRWEDQEQALLTSCSSLITITKTGDLRVVQFSHFSVKEFMTSTRLSTASVDVARYHIVLEPAHVILAQVCTSILLLPEDRAEENDGRKSSNLARYAAQHWATHVKVENVSSFLREAMEHLFDLDKPYFAAWLQLHDLELPPDEGSSSLYWFAVSTKSGITPLYYAALCGFRDLVECLIFKYPQHVNSSGGYYATPLVAALAGRHFQTAKLLYLNGAHVNLRGYYGATPLHSAAWYGDLEMVRVLLDYAADVNAMNQDDWTPIHYASEGSLFPATTAQLLPDVARLLLEHGADANARNNRGLTPLHFAAANGRVEVVRVLLEHGADVNAVGVEGRTPLHFGVDYGRVKVVRVLLEHGASVGAEDNKGQTPFRIASAKGWGQIMNLLSEYGAN